MLLCCLHWSACTPGLAEAAETSPASSPPQDLTGMSLHEVLHADVTPINVLGSHTHLKNDIMVGYRYMYTDMSHNQDGTHEVSEEEVLSQYPVVHTRMAMQMHMLEAMYAPSDSITLEAMVPFSDIWMDHLDRTGERSRASSSGLSDVGFMGLFNVVGNPRTLGHRLVINAGFTAPTGSVDEGQNGRRYEYALQLGSGTWDLKPGLTYLGNSDLFSWGAQALGTIRLGENEHDYRLGNGYRVSGWVQAKVFDWFGPSARLDWHGWEDIHGADPQLNPNRNPAFDATKQAGERLDFLLGLNFYVPHGLLKGNRFSIEGGLPLYQNIDGPNLGVDWLVTVGWTYMFH